MAAAKLPTDRDLLYHKLQYGELTPQQAETEAARLGLKPLAPRPDPVSFNPMNETWWTLVMTCAWIARRSVDAVRDNWDTYRTECCDWHHIRTVVVDWVNYLRKEKLWGLDDPLFPMTKVAVGGAQKSEVVGLERRPWSSAGPIRAIFKTAFGSAGLPYFNPHSFRKTLALLGEKLCQTPEQYKAWSQNLGHEHVLTTFTSYGEVSSHRQAEIIRTLHL